MHRLRTHSLLTRIVLAWFVLALGVAVAAPVVNPQSMELVCSAAGTAKLLVKDADGAAQPMGATMDCPLCMPSAPPPAPAVAVLPQPQPLAHALQPLVAAHIASLVGAPLPPRGPPAHS